MLLLPLVVLDFNRKLLSNKLFHPATYTEDVSYVDSPSVLARLNSIFTVKRMRQHVAQTTSGCGLSDRVSVLPEMHLERVYTCA